jgi:mannose-6-phosphate isomerase-like protein (cupin superfamily)
VDGTVGGGSAHEAPSVQRFGPVAGDDAVRFSDEILVVSGLGVEAGAGMSTYTTHLAAGAEADLPAPYEEVWVVLSGALRVGLGSAAVAVRAGEHVHVPVAAPGVVRAIEATTMVCVSVPAH